MTFGYFFVESPLQALSATEARAAYGLDPSSAIAVVGEATGNVEGTRQLDEVLRRGSWRRVARTASWLTGPDRSALAFSGDYRKAWQREACHRVGDRQPKVLDDGNATLLIAGRRQHRLWRLSDPALTWARGRRDARVPIPGLLHDLRRPASREHRAVEFFTIYDLGASRSDTVRANRFEVLRAAAAAPTSARPVYIGSSLSEQGMLLDGVMDRRLREVIATYGDGVLYVAHRRESDEKLERYQRELGLEVVRPSGPLELFLTDAGVRPAPLLGTLSSAFDTLRVVFRDLEVVRTPPTPEEISPRARGAMLRLIDASDRARLQIDRSSAGADEES